MAVSKITRAVIGALLALPLLVGAQWASAAPASAADVTVLQYDASGAAEFTQVVHEAAQIWNESVDNVQLEPGGSADFVIVADNGWPRARVTSLGHGTIWMGRQAVDQGHDPTRIAAHEIGHILGLPDRRTGRCEDLMSGHSAGTECTNAHPSPREAAQVEANFAYRSTGVVSRQMFVDSVPVSVKQQ